jgi:hypothetical protein
LARRPADHLMKESLVNPLGMAGRHVRITVATDFGATRASAWPRNEGPTFAARPAHHAVPRETGNIGDREGTR